MKKIIAISLSAFLIMPIFIGTTYADSEVSVTVNPSTRDSLAEYNISFVTNADLVGGKDDIIIQFPEGTTLPCSCPHNWHLENFLINGNKPARAGKMTDVPNAMYLEMPGGITIKAGKTVNIVIKSQTNIWNPKTPGIYKLTLWTTKQGKMQSNEYEITSTKIQNFEVTTDPDTAELVASYKITFTTGAKGNLSNGQSIYIQFPEGTIFPAVIHTNGIEVNGEYPGNVTIQNNVMNITLSHSINSKRDVKIVINGSFGLQNPDGGTYKLRIWSDNEPEKVETEFQIKAQNTVYTQVNIIPPLPDGINDYYKTKPVVSLSGETNLEETVQTFYKLDEGEYEIYESPITIPEGIHNLYYYSKTNTLTEKEKSTEFNVDITNPVINIEFPEDNPFYTGDALIHIYGKLSEPAQLFITHKYIPLKNDLSFSKEITLIPGKNIIDIYAIDNAGNKTNKTITIVFDTTVPTLNITSPNDWDTIKTEKITVQGSVSPANTEVYINNKETNVANNGEFTFSFVPGNEGNLTPLKVKAIYPLSKKSVTKIITVVYDPSLPEVILTINSHTALVNGEEKKMDVAPFIDKNSDRTLVPVRFVVEFLGGEVSWDGETRKVAIQLNGKEIKLQIDSSTAYVNNTAVKLDQPAIIKEDRTFVPLRFVTETFGFNVKWDASTRSITITTP